MRWRQHLGITRDSAGNRCNTALLLGSILPDWFERKNHHTTELVADKIFARCKFVSKLKHGFRRDFVIGTILHYAHDFVCCPHDVKYDDYLHHAIYEVSLQRYYLKYSSKNRRYSLESEHSIAGILNTSDKMDAVEIIKTFTSIAHSVHKAAVKSNSEWYLDEGIMYIDTMIARQLSYWLLKNFYT